jgi:hypothetical protein
VTRRWLAFIAVGAVLLSGCSKKQEANDTLPSPSAAETTPELPSLGPDDMPMPAEARTQDAAGAEAFVRYYIALINRTSDVMDAAPLRDLSKDCEDCNRIATETEQDALAGYTYEGGNLTVTEVTSPLITDSRAEMAIRVSQAEMSVLDSNGKPIDDLGSGAYPGLPGTAAAEWDSERTSWTMTTLSFGSS